MANKRMPIAIPSRATSTDSASYILFGEGDTAPVTHEVVRDAEPNLER
jgi:hypothetical protein